MLGISLATTISHANFPNNCNILLPWLSDTHGVILKIDRKVAAANHGVQILSVLKILQCEKIMYYTAI